MPAPLLLCIRDGWGVAPAGPGNAVSLARTPVLDKLLASAPGCLIDPCGKAVGLPEGQMGNSEVGHMNIGAGRVVYQDLTRIDHAIETGALASNDVLREALGKPRVQLFGLVSDGGVHSAQRHLEALLSLAKERGAGEVYIHAILDGRDTPPTGGVGYIEKLLAACEERGIGRLASLCGRYYAMDRDNRWERVERAYRCYVAGEGKDGSAPLEAIRASYGEDVTDEFLLPHVVAAEGRVREDDSLLFFNFRADRMRQLVRALCLEDFDAFARPFRCRTAACMTRYDETFGLPVAFAPQSFSDTLPQLISDQGWGQLRIAETEKFAHVTYFTSCGREQPFPGEERILIPSPRVATYDLAPAMSAEAVTEKLLAAIRSRKFPLIILNYANADMVGHTGKIPACIEAVEVIDRLLGTALGALDEVGGQALITADHGNIEQLLDEQGGPHTAHTTNRVHLLWHTSDARGRSLADGALCDIAPTILELFGVPQPAAMTGSSLLRSP